MKQLFINFTNHPSVSWGQEQLDAAHCFGEILDIPFPNVPPSFTSEEITRLGEEYTNRILAAGPSVVLCQGEFSLAYDVICRLKQHNIKVLAACSERNTVMVGNERRSIFSFVQFREYL